MLTKLRQAEVLRTGDGCVVCPHSKQRVVGDHDQAVADRIVGKDADGIPTLDGFDANSLHFEMGQGESHNRARVAGLGAGVNYLICWMNFGGLPQALVDDARSRLSEAQQEFETTLASIRESQVDIAAAEAWLAGAQNPDGSFGSLADLAPLMLITLGVALARLHPAGLGRAFLLSLAKFVVTLAVVSFLGLYLPARRASLVDPVRALTSE